MKKRLIKVILFIGLFPVAILYPIIIPLWILSGRNYVNEYIRFTRNYINDFDPSITCIE